MTIKVIYLLFLSLILSGSFISIGELPIRYIVMFLLLAQVALRERLYFDKSWKLYLLFILCFGFSCIAANYTDKFLNSIFKQYFIAFVVWVSTVAVLRKDSSFIKYIAMVYLIIGAFDVVVNLSQFFFNTSWYEPIESFFKFKSDDEFSNIVEKRSSFRDVNDGTLRGIFGNGVINGYYLSICSVLSMIFIVQKRKLIYFSITLFYLAGLFVCQQRGPLFFSIMSIMILSWLISNKLLFRNRTIMFLFFATLFICGFLYISDISSNLGLRYSTRGIDATVRNNIFIETLEYLSDNPFLPNIYELIDIKGHAPHNLFLNAYVYGGLISFILIISILFIQTRHIFWVIKGGQVGMRAYFYVFAFAWITFTLNTMLHNRSIVTGDVTIWLLWAVLYSYPYINYKRTTIR